MGAACSGMAPAAGGRGPGSGLAGRNLQATLAASTIEAGYAGL
jgi:hypothetical protein